MSTESDIDRYARQAARLLPRGSIWTKTPGSELDALLHGLAGVLATIEERGRDLIDETDPRTVEELIGEWEELLGLPEPGCSDNPGTNLLRRYAIFAKYTRQGGQSRQFFIDLADAIGFTIEIEELRPYVVGGPSAIGDKLYTDPWIFAWKVHAPVHTVTFARAGKHRAGEPIAFSDSGLLECTINAAKPSHTHVIFVYDLPYDGWAPWKEIYPEPVILELNTPSLIIS